MPEAVKKPAETNIKETVESILVAFILAFIFRAFVVEAFVIPTGSMAPTLLGAHTAYICPECGYHYTVNYPTSEENNTVNVPSFASYVSGNQVIPKAQACFCPNCGYRLPRKNSDDPANDAIGAPVNYGDRILVMKYVYLLNAPRRWDVIVFKSPDTRDTPPDYSVNYIKRLAGLPGESLFVLDGDLYTGKSPADRPLARGDEKLFTIQTKPKYAQDALWRIVYDTDYVPRSLGAERPVIDSMGTVVSNDTPWRQPWVTADGNWLNGTKGVDLRTFRFDDLSGKGTLAFDPSANPEKRALTDWLAYDVTMNQMGRDMMLWRSDTSTRESNGNVNPPPGSDSSNVSDVKVDFYVKRFAGEGPLKVLLTKRDTAFVAELTPTTAAIWMQQAGGAWKQVGGRVSINLGATPTRVTFQNVDYRAALSIDGKEIIATTPADYAPDIAALIAADAKGEIHPKPDIRIVAERQTSEITHLALWRDDYYTDHQGGGLVPRANAYYFPSNVVTLGQKEYFPLGDNSPISGDARVWGNVVNQPNENLYARAGVVPERFLLGRAFFVYWPAGFRPLGESPPALVPNFGKMRFIY